MTDVMQQIRDGKKHLSQVLGSNSPDSPWSAQRVDDASDQLIDDSYHVIVKAGAAALVADQRPDWVYVGGHGSSGVWRHPTIDGLTIRVYHDGRIA